MLVAILRVEFCATAFSDTRNSLKIVVVICHGEVNRCQAFMQGKSEGVEGRQGG